MFVLSYRDAGDDNRDSHRRYFLQRVKVESYNIETDGRNIYDQPINDLIKPRGQVDDYITGCLLDFAYFKKITN